MKRAFTVVLFLTTFTALVWANSAPVVSNVTASQRTDGSGIVDISYTLSDADNNRCTITILASNNGGSTWTITSSASALSGDGTNVSPGRRHITWASKTDLPGIFGSNYRVKVTADDSMFPPGPSGMVWVSINDPGVSGHEGFNGQMSKYEITNAQYCQFLNEAQITVPDYYVCDVTGLLPYYHLPGQGEYANGAIWGGAARINYTGSSFTVDSGFENHPVTYVTWCGATAFCNYYGYRLLTEWEWQAVADYKGSFTYGCGTTISITKANCYGSTHPDGTTVVGAFGTYGYGMCDMAGNVWEWTSSVYNIYDPSYFICGGAWYGNYGCYDMYNVSTHVECNAWFAWYNLGFRVCRGPVLAGTGYGLSNVFTIDNRDGSGVRITSLVPAYTGVFPEGVDIINTVEATVDWSDKTPSRVIFSINSDQKQVNTANTIAQTTYNMGQDLEYANSGAGNKLLVWAVAADGTVSPTVQLYFGGLELPEWIFQFSEKENGEESGFGWKYDYFTGKVTFFGEVELLKERPGGTISIPEKIPLIGGKYGVTINPLTFNWELSAQPRFGDGSGLTGSFDLSGEGGLKAECGSDRELNVSVPLSGAGEFYPKLRLKDVSFKPTGSLEFKLPRVPLLCQWTGCCHTGYCPYFQASFKPEITGTVAMEEGEPAQFYGLKFKEGELELAITVAGTVGAGSEGSIYYIAGTIGGKPSITFQFPANTSSYCMNKFIKESAFVLKAKCVVESAWWSKENEWTFNLYTCPETGKMVAMGCPSGVRQVVPVDRNYLRADEGYCVFPGLSKQSGGAVMSMSVGGLPNPILNVGTSPMPSVAANDNSGLLVFVYDDAGKPTGKHQEIYYARWNGFQWTSHAPITNNLKPDIQPVAEIDSAGRELAVWVSGPEPTGSETGPRDILPSFEISYSQWDGVAWTTPQNITNNSFADLLPWFDTKSDGTLRVCWIASSTNAIPVWHDEEIAPLIDVMSSDWNGISFGTPYTIASNLVTVSPPAVVQDSTYEYIAYLKDMDDNSGTAEDRKIYVRKRLLGGAWESDQRLTNDTISDSTAQMVINDAGVPMLVWVKRMVPVTSSDPNQNTYIDQLWFSECQDGDWMTPTRAFEYDGITEPKLFRNTADKVVLFWVAASKEFSDIYYGVYDAELMQWGSPQQNTHDQGAETMISLSESGGNILASYVKRRIDLSDPYNPPVIGLSDIYLMEHVPAKDLYISNDDISFNLEPVPDANSIITANVHLSGDFTVIDVDVKVYDGDPAFGGNLISTYQIAQMLPGQAKPVSILWRVPSDGQSHPIYVVVDPNNTIPETDDFGNNKAYALPFFVNLIPKAPVAAGYPTADKVIVGISVKNTGSMDSQAIGCQVRKGSATGLVIFETTFDNISAGESASTQFEWDVSRESAGIYDLVVIADPNNVISESLESDNNAVGSIQILPDLQAEQWSAAVNGTVASITIRNVGAKPSDPNICSGYFNALNLGESAIPALNPGGSIDINIPLSSSVEAGRVDIVANPDSGGTDEVSLTNNIASVILFAPGDFEPDGDVDLIDLMVLVEQWLQTPGTPSADIAPEPRDDFVNLEDFARFAQYWRTNFNL